MLKDSERLNNKRRLFFRALVERPKQREGREDATHNKTVGEWGQNNGRETMTKRGREGGEAVLTGQNCIFFL